MWSCEVRVIPSNMYIFFFNFHFQNIGDSFHSLKKNDTDYVLLETCLAFNSRSVLTVFIIAVAASMLIAM